MTVVFYETEKDCFDFALKRCVRFFTFFVYHFEIAKIQ